MANVVVTLKIMPGSPEEDLNKIEADAKKKIIDFAGEGEVKSEKVPVAFGLKSLKIIFVMPEDKGSTEPIEDAVGDIKGVQSVEVSDVRRAVG
ncbi:elongation factor 1-beta [Candidatus Woesearchaeota archaeon]|nr:elongation factor 1-beta [Candidatus Woesearchaeota archaeon]